MHFRSFLIYLNSGQLFPARKNSQILLYKKGFQLKTGNFGKSGSLFFTISLHRCNISPELNRKPVFRESKGVWQVFCRIMYGMNILENYGLYHYFFLLQSLINN